MVVTRRAVLMPTFSEFESQTVGLVRPMPKTSTLLAGGRRIVFVLRYFDVDGKPRCSVFPSEKDASDAAKKKGSQCDVKKAVI
jgi:hypothetical protein